LSLPLYIILKEEHKTGMDIYSPSHLTPYESDTRMQDFNERVAQMNISDETIQEYIETFFDSYRKTIEQFFLNLAPSIPFYSRYPFETYILRLGTNGVFIGHRPGPVPLVRIMRPSDFDPPLEAINILDIAQRWQVSVLSFDTNPRAYDAEEAKVEGIRRALRTALDYFWHLVNPIAFEQLCKSLL
jgi:hypothetical protein